MVFYVEYVGYGAAIGSQLAAGGQTRNALGTLMVLGAVVACGLGSMFARGAILAGPRAASVAVFALGLELIATQNESSAKFTTTTFGMLVMLLVAAITQLAGTHPKVREIFAKMPVFLSRGFMFASAVSIVAGMANDQLSYCINANWALALAIFAGAVGVGVGLQWAGENFARLSFLATLSLPVAVLLAWAAFAPLEPYFSNDRSHKCNTLGSGGLQWTALADQMPLAHLGRGGFDSISFSVIWLPILCGLFLGTVMLIESLTTLEGLTASDKQTGSFLKTDWSRNIRVSAAVNMLSSLFGLACSSWSTSRSKLMGQAGARSRFSSLIHGLSIALIAIIAEPWMSRLPVLAIAVALTLVGVQMIDSKTVGLWQPGYRANAKPQNLWGVWWFWLILAITFYFEKAIIAFVFAWGVYSVHHCLLLRSRHARAKASRERRQIVIK